MIAALIAVAASANAALLAAALLYRSWLKGAPAALYAGAFLLTAAAAIGMIALGHAGIGLDPRASAFVEGVLTLLSGPLLVLFVARLLGLNQAAPVLFAPLVLFLLAAFIWPTWTLRAFAIERLVLVQMAYTAYAAGRALAIRPSGQKVRRARSMALAAVGALAVLHGAQIVRMVFSEVEAVEDVVPLVGAAAFLALAGFVYFGGRVAALEPLTEASLAPTEEMQSLIGNLDKALLAGLLRDANLSQAQAAMAINATSQDVATALAAVHGVSFAEHIQRLRVQEARRLLADPREARTSMEAIGLLAGFGSRSAFYKAFRDVVGESPAAYRAGNPRNRVQMQENGQ